MKNGDSIYIVTGYDETQDVEFGCQHRVSFLRTSKTPIIKSFLFASSSFRKLNKTKADYSADIVHANLPLVPNFAVPLDFGRRLISTVHSTWKGEAEAIRGEPFSRLNSNEKFLVSFNWFLRVFEERMLERSNRIIAVSEFTRRELLKYYAVKPGKIHVIHNGVDPQKFQPTANKDKAKAEVALNSKDTVILSVGRLYARKGLFTLVEAMPPIVKRFSNVRLIISGKGQSNEMKKLVDYATKLGVINNIVFTGYFPDKKLPRLYQAADIFAFSTFYEHHPFAVLEAMSTGLPIVTNKVGGIPETIENGQNGFLCSPFNPREFSEKIIYLLEHPALASEMAKSARQTVLERFDWRHVVKRVLRIYEETLS